VEICALEDLVKAMKEAIKTMMREMRAEFADP
jgi:hypothetical protein